ncbi:MAG: glycosyltransferase family 2 protein [Defluviitaleaceae bacterium]|nr:glycosyltransferase family 2 protein [Defluviitaleaceae bacterium]MCL2835474.1 glycosyltransferase family 2 protein [Defluviitaleaceae bacterium]
MRPVLSVVVPVYNEEEVLQVSYARLNGVLTGLGITYELIFINDGSRDRTPEMLRELSERDANVKVVFFSRNFGHQAAITAGMEYSSGDAVVVIDADLQDPPEVIPLMLEKWREGFDVVYGKRVKRHGETAFKKISARLFYRILRKMTVTDIPVDTGDFRLIDRKVCDTLTTFGERSRFVRGLVSWVGFKQTSVEFIREERFAGETKYPLRKMIELSISGMVSFSNKPLRLAAFFGLVSSASGFIWLLILLINSISGAQTEGWAVAVAIMLFTQGLVFITIGIMGEYMGRIYDEVRARPYYIVRDTLGFVEKK